MNKSKNFIALLFAGIAYGSFGIWIRLLSHDLTSYQQIFVRNVLGFIFSIIVVLLLKQKWDFKRVNKLHVVLYAVSFSISQVFYTFSMLSTKLEIATFAFFAASFIGSFLLGKFIFSDKTNLFKIIGLILAFLGIIVLSFKSFSSSLINLGFIFGFLGGIFDSTTNAFRRELAGKVDRFALVAVQMLGGIVVAIIFLTIFGQKLPMTISSTTILVAILFGLLLMSLNFLMNFGFQDFDLNLGTIILSIELVAAPIFGLLVFKEVPSNIDILGGGLILMAIIISNLKHSFGPIHNNQRL